MFSEPTEGLFARVQNHPAVVVRRLPAGFSLLPVPAEDGDKRKRFDPKDNPFTHWFTNFSEADELLKLAAARQQRLPLDPRKPQGVCKKHKVWICGFFCSPLESSCCYYGNNA